MGLLNTALDTKDSKKKSYEEFIISEGNLSTDETYPSESLNLFCNFFGIKKALFLLYNPKDDLWLPVVQNGIDVTSSRRVRFNNKFLSSVFKEEHFNALTSPEDLQNFKPLLSIREFSGLKNIVFVKQKETAFLSINSHMIEQSLFVKEEIKALTLILDKLSKLESIKKSAVPNDSSVIPFVSRYLSKHKDSVIFLIKLQYEDLISIISESGSENQEDKQISQDIFDTVFSMVNISGRILQIDFYTSLLLFSSNTLKNPQLLITQIESTLKNYFNIQSDLPVIKRSYILYPEHGRDAEVLLSKLDIL
ncbi:MAG: hypothetical protein DRP59_01005 [Spirochaetes bacterium]|nr:MAG: hypothetical protein DRP59_01005 [Spirochaetota bacterium]